MQHFHIANKQATSYFWGFDISSKEPF